MRKSGAALPCFLFLAASLVAMPALAEEYDLPTRNWSTTDSRSLDAYPPSNSEVARLVNHTLDTDWNIPVCSFKFIDVFDGNFRLVAGLDGTGRRTCNRVVVIEKRGTYFHAVNDWKALGANHVAEMMHDMDRDHSPEIILTEAWSKPEGGHCVATFPRIYKWSRGRFEDQSASYKDWYKKRQSDLKASLTGSDSVCRQMELDKIARLLGTKDAGYAQAVLWMKNSDPSLRRKAAAVFADMGTDSAKKNLAQLTKDADPLTAESARLYQESPYASKE